MLLIDGVKYELWTPSTEDELEQMVKEHAQDIFGEQSIYFDKKQKLKSLSGIGSIPDGYAISFQGMPCWYICEVELHTHPLYEHIVPQMTKFINGVKSLSSQREIINAFYGELNRDPFNGALVRSKIGSAEVYHFISDLISKPPILIIVIDQKTKELEEVCDSLPIEVKIVEFQTFTREGIGLPVHAHLFEPLYKPVISTKPELPPPPPPENSFEVALAPSCMKYYYIHIPKPSKDLFPNFKTTLELSTDIGLLQVGFNTDPDWGSYFQKDFAKWFKAHPELRQGDRVRITVLESMKQYRLEIVN